MDGLSSAMLCVLVEYEDNIATLGTTGATKGPDWKFGDLMVINALDVDVPGWVIEVDEAQVAAGNAAVRSPVEKGLAPNASLRACDVVGARDLTVR